MYVCKYCQQSFDDKIYFQRHVEFCENVGILCDSCENVIPIQYFKYHPCKLLIEKQNKIEEQDKLLKENELKIQSLNHNIELLKTREIFWKELLRTNTDIDVNSLSIGKDPAIKIERKGKKKVKKVKKVKKREIFRSVKNQAEQIVSNDEDDIEKENKDENIEKVVAEDDKNYEIKDEKDEDEEEKEEKEEDDEESIFFEISRLLDKLKSSHRYNNVLQSIKKYRTKLFSMIPLDEYTNLLRNHVKQFKEIFLGKQFPYRKLNRVIFSCFNELELRIISYYEYYNTTLTPDHIDEFASVLDMNMTYCKQYTPFNVQVVLNNLQNYGFALFSLEECLKRAIVSPYNYPNIVYIKMKKSSDDDPYSFYTLGSVENKVRKWRLDCRLEKLTTDISDALRPYGVSLFRRIYRDVFGDNVYRPKFQSEAPILRDDCEQLLINVYRVSNYHHLQIELQHIVKKYISIVPVESKDKCNLTTDDKLGRFDKGENDDCEISIANQLFDGISPTNAIKFWSERT